MSVLSAKHFVEYAEKLITCWAEHILRKVCCTFSWLHTAPALSAGYVVDYTQKCPCCLPGVLLITCWAERHEYSALNVCLITSCMDSTVRWVPCGLHVGLRRIIVVCQVFGQLFKLAGVVDGALHHDTLKCCLHLMRDQKIMFQ